MRRLSKIPSGKLEMLFEVRELEDKKRANYVIDTRHIWSAREKKPKILFSLPLFSQRITQLPTQKGIMSNQFYLFFLKVQLKINTITVFWDSLIALVSVFLIMNPFFPFFFLWIISAQQWYLGTFPDTLMRTNLTVHFMAIWFSSNVCDLYQAWNFWSNNVHDPIISGMKWQRKETKPFCYPVKNLCRDFINCQVFWTHDKTLALVFEI